MISRRHLLLGAAAVAAVLSPRERAEAFDPHAVAASRPAFCPSPTFLRYVSILALQGQLRIYGTPMFPPAACGVEAAFDKAVTIRTLS